MITQCHDKYLKDTLEPDDGYPYHELYAWSEFYIANKTNSATSFKWKNRYDSLKQDTSFFKNIVSVHGIIWECNSVDELHMRTDILCIPAEAVNFVVCYTWNKPSRWFSFDWRLLLAHPVDVSLREDCAWYIVDALHKIIVDGNLPMIKVEGFLNLKI